MCGIFGILTTLKNQNIYKIIIDGLIQLQNRGYDSSGICILNNNNFEINKYASTNNYSSIEKLLSLNLSYGEGEYNISLGIGHNRWATHGAKNDINAHPHSSNDKKFVLVHNGIIENYQELKEFLIKNGYIFYSQTDTEVIVNLISYYYNKEIEENKENNIRIITGSSSFSIEHSFSENTFNAIKKTIHNLQGTYGIIVMNCDENDKLYAVRNGSPLLVGLTDEYSIITSEQSGFCNMVNNYITLNNDDICVISKNNDGNRINIQTSNQYIHKKVNINNYDLTPDPYKHWTIKEINEQVSTIFNTINRGGRIKSNNEVKLGGLEPHTDFLKSVDNIIILGCGTSFHAGLYGAYYLKTLCNFNSVQVFDGAEFNEYDIPKNGNSVFLLISQSGETKDLHRCIEIAKKNNIFTIGIINVVDSLIAREVDCGIYCNAGREMGVASTKAFTSQVICLSMFAIWCAQINNLNEIKRIKMIKDLHNLGNDFKNTIQEIEEEIKIIASNLLKYNNLFLLGKGTDEYIAKEGSLKIKEISYIHSEGYSSSSLKHGPFALLDENFPVIILNCHEEHSAKTINCFEEVHSRNSPILIITNNQNIDLKRSCKVVKIPKNNSYSSLLGIVPLQLLAYYLSIGRGINPDIPKNLAKVVTVE
jgi:glucosamine--fructose-6-phosphate aminotransferase (isomerizing)